MTTSLATARPSTKRPRGRPRKPRCQFNPQTRRLHDVDTGNLVSRELVIGGKYKLLDANGKETRRLPPLEEWSQPRHEAPPEPPAPETPPPPAAATPDAPAADVVVPTFSEAEGVRAVADPATQQQPPSNDNGEPEQSDRPPDTLEGFSSECPSCGVMPKVCPEGHTYYEGSSTEECAELVDVWVMTCQAVAAAARGSKPKPIPRPLRNRFAKVIQRQSKKYPPLTAKIEIPLLMAATATSCTEPANDNDESPKEQEVHAQAAAAADAESTNGTGAPHRRRAGAGVDL